MHSSNTFQKWINPFSGDTSPQERLFFFIRFGMLGCFVGHGMWGLMLKPGWIPFFELFGIEKNTAHYLMPLVGAMDIAIGLIAFFRPNRAILVYALFWTLFTAMLRPLAGMGFSEFLERAGNYGLPLVFLFLYHKPQRLSDWWTALDVPNVQKLNSQWVEKALQWSIVLLLIGHGGLATFVHQHPVITRNFTFVFGGIQTTQLQIFGVCEMALALLFLWKPRAPFLLAFILVFKVAVEILHPMAGAPKEIFETIERAGDYFLPLALMTVYGFKFHTHKLFGNSQKEAKV